MPKKIKNCFYANLTFSKLLQAHYRAKQHKTYKNEVISYELNLENNLVNLLNQIKTKKYILGNYRSFIIYEPKKRIIEALPYQDRIVHQWYVEEFIKPYLIPKLIPTTYACLIDRGTHKAVEKVQEYMRIFQRNFGSFWILKCDIYKFFYSINPHILFCIMKKYISDKALLEFTHLLIFDKRGTNNKIGIPIGNYTSQFFANIYLNELDQYIKRILKVKYYVRYMDDFILLTKTKKDCILLKQLIEQFLSQNLHLSLNNKSRYYPSKMGVNFCGYRIFTTHRLLRNTSKKLIKRKIKNWNKLYQNHQLNLEKAVQSINSWIGHSSHCNSYLLQKRMLNRCEFLWNEHTTYEMEKKFIHTIEEYKNEQSHT